MIDWDEPLRWNGWTVNGYGPPPSVTGEDAPESFRDVGTVTVKRSLGTSDMEVLGMTGRGIGYGESLGAYGLVKQAVLVLSREAVSGPVTGELDTPEGRVRLYLYLSPRYGATWRLEVL